MRLGHNPVAISRTGEGRVLPNPRAVPVVEHNSLSSGDGGSIGWELSPSQWELSVGWSISRGDRSNVIPFAPGPKHIDQQTLPVCGSVSAEVGQQSSLLRLVNYLTLHDWLGGKLGVDQV